VSGEEAERQRLYLPPPRVSGALTREDVDAWAAEMVPMIRVALGMTEVPDHPPTDEPPAP
jgi:hypothetical protein